MSVINKCRRDLKNEYPNAVIEKKYDISEADIQADTYCYDLFYNLIENGIIHNDEFQPHVWIRLKELDSGYLVEIADNGPGFSPSRKEAIFDPKRRFGGVGLQGKHIVFVFCDLWLRLASLLSNGCLGSCQSRDGQSVW